LGRRRRPRRLRRPARWGPGSPVSRGRTSRGDPSREPGSASPSPRAPRSPSPPASAQAAVAAASSQPARDSRAHDPSMATAPPFAPEGYGARRRDRSRRIQDARAIGRVRFAARRTSRRVALHLGLDGPRDTMTTARHEPIPRAVDATACGFTVGRFGTVLRPSADFELPATGVPFGTEPPTRDRSASRRLQTGVRFRGSSIAEFIDVLRSQTLVLAAGPRPRGRLPKLSPSRPHEAKPWHQFY